MYDAWGQFSRFFGVGSEHLLMSITSRSDAALDEMESAGPAGAGATTKWRLRQRCMQEQVGSDCPCQQPGIRRYLGDPRYRQLHRQSWALAVVALPSGTCAAT